MPRIWTELSRALRSLRQSPGPAAVAIVSLALGLGANVTIFSVVREMILDNVSARRPDRLVRAGGEVSYAAYRNLRRAGAFQDLAFDAGLDNAAWNRAGQGEVVWEMATSANFFEVLGIRAAAGRLYMPTDEGLPVAVVSYGFWSRRLHSDPRAMGRPLEINSRLYTVLGVLPRDYRSIMGHGISPEVYVVAPADSRRCRLFGRLRDGATREQTRQAWVAAAERIGGPEWARQIASLRPMAGLGASAAGAGDDRRFFLFFAMLFGTAAMLAGIACFNVAGLLLARGITRRREFAIRRALGAGRLAIAREALTEGLVLVSLGAGAGLIADALVRNRLRSIRWPSAYNLPFEFHFSNDRGLFLYALALAAAALLACSLIPCLRDANADPGLAMKQGEPSFSLRRFDLRNGFVALQAALSMALLALGVLFFRGFLQVARTGPGFDTSHLEMVTVWPPAGQHLRGEDGWNWRDGLVRRLKEVPGVTGVTSIGTLPFMGELPQEAVRRKGDAAAAARDAYQVGAGEEFCKVLGIAVLRGRDFEAADRTRNPAPVLVDETLARRLFGAADPIGAELLVGRDTGHAFEIIGVTADARMRTLGEAHAPMFFTPYADPQMLVRTAGDPARWIPPLRAALSGVETASATDIRPLSEAAAGAIFPMRAAAAFAGAMSGLGLLLALSGIYSSVGYATERRTREIAIRAAIGATRATVVWTAIRDGLGVLACGTMVGLPLAIAAIQPLRDILPDGLDPWKPGMFAGIILVLLAAGVAAAWIPARRAAGVQPSAALRHE